MFSLCERPQAEQKRQRRVDVHDCPCFSSRLSHDGQPVDDLYSASTALALTHLQPCGVSCCPTIQRSELCTEVQRVIAALAVFTLGRAAACLCAGDAGGDPWNAKLGRADWHVLYLEKVVILGDIAF